MLKRLKELASDSLTYGLSSMLSQFLSLILVPFFTKELRPEDYGVLAMSALVLGFFSPLASLGMDGALFRFYALTEDPARKNVYFSLATQIKTAAMLAVSLLLIPFYSLLNGAFFENLLSPLQFGLILWSFLGDNFSALTVVMLRSERRVKKIAAVNIATLLINLTLSVWLVLFEKMGVTGALVAGLSASIFRAILYWSDSRQHFIWTGLDRALCKDLLGYGLPVVPHKVQAHFIHIFTAFMINHKLGIAASGMYAVATKMAKPLSFVVSIAQQSWVPYKFNIHKTESDPGHIFRQLISLYWIGIIMLWGLFSLITPWLYHWLIDPEYWAGIPFVPFIMAISVAQAIYFTVTTGFELSPRQRLIVRASFLSMITMVGLSLLSMDFFIPYNFIVAQALAYLIMGGVLFSEAQKMLKIAYPIWFIVVFAALITCIVSLLFNDPQATEVLLGIAAIIIVSIICLGTMKLTLQS
ncbi:MAG: lipopolysaccharide biosynthesis protein [Saprospiraceae bacterium]